MRRVRQIESGFGRVLLDYLVLIKGDFTGYGVKAQAWFADLERDREGAI
jgi:hypothetical protein